MIKKCKRLWAAAVAALAVATAGGAEADASMYMKNPGVDTSLDLDLDSVTNNKKSILSNKNINIGSYQHNGKVTMSVVEDTVDIKAAGKDENLGLIKTHDTHSQYTLGLGLDSFIKLKECVKESRQKQKFLSDVDAAFAISNGRRSPYGSVGCAETVAYAGSYYSPALKDAFYLGIASVPSLVENLVAQGYAVEPFVGYANKGDLLIYGDYDHVVIADGLGGCFGNSSSRLHAMYYPDASSAWHYGEMPSKVVRMS